MLGDAVNVAARLCAEAGPGEILVSEALLHVVRKPVDYEYLPELGLKGKTQVVQVYRVKAGALPPNSYGSPASSIRRSTSRIGSPITLKKSPSIRSTSAAP